jgi:hypothetical protein
MSFMSTYRGVMHRWTCHPPAHDGLITRTHRGLFMYNISAEHFVRIEAWVCNAMLLSGTVSGGAGGFRLHTVLT